ncbi:MAG: Carbonate dehydratase [Bacteroidetes bacterium]|jgi:carbonic anhydrase|nr:Carbonate dehydratase [Bacteroidota bacterium]
MQSLFDGVKEFNSGDFIEHQELFEKIGRNQEPHTLFIGCSDSRVVPNLITKTLPGELFVIRNIANIVPVYRKSEEFLATTSAIEYAVKVLNISTILVCGHSNCGGCNALFMDEERAQQIPHTRKWLELAKNVREKMIKLRIADPAVREWMTEQLNIVEQMNHLLTYPYIAEKYENGELDILGWYYIIETGEVFNYDKKDKKFSKIE